MSGAGFGIRFWIGREPKDALPELLCRLRQVRSELEQYVQESR
jgi:hypothetical protein